MVILSIDGDRKTHLIVVSEGKGGYGWQNMSLTIRRPLTDLSEESGWCLGVSNEGSSLPLKK